MSNSRESPANDMYGKMFPSRNNNHARKDTEKDRIQQRADEHDEFAYPSYDDENPPQGQFIIAEMTYFKFYGGDKITKVMGACMAQCLHGPSNYFPCTYTRAFTLKRLLDPVFLHAAQGGSSVARYSARK